MSNSDAPDSPDDVSLVRNDLPFRLQRRIGLVPPDGLGIGRRALLWVAIAWLPLVVWGWWTGRTLGSQAHPAEPLLAHFAVHARLLFGIPLLIIAEAVAHKATAQLLPQFAHAGIVPAGELAAFRAILARTARLRDATLPWALIVALAFGWTASATFATEAERSLGFGGWWYAFVGRPVFIALLLGWLWRLALLAITLRRIAKLDLVIVATHADHCGGLGFLERFASAFSLVAFVIALVLASGWAHAAEFHGLDVHTLYPAMGVALVILTVLFLWPYLAFIGPLGRAKRQALLDYGVLIARHGAAVHGKWVGGDATRDDPLLAAPELGPVADTAGLYEGVRQMRVLPLGRTALMAIVVPVLLPFAGVLAIQIPLKELLGQLLKGIL